MKFSLILLAAILLDNILGDPKFLYHPVILIGKIVKFLHNATFFNKNYLTKGLVVCALTVSTTGLFIFLILYLSNCSVLIQIYLLYSALAWRDLKDETELIFSYLLKNDIKNARKYLSFVVGRDTKNLNIIEITRATIETISENCIDGIMSVIFFSAIGYLIDKNYGMCICVWIFKAVSTLDSMIGYEHFGKLGLPSAKLDDIMNFIPARLGGLVIVLSQPLCRGKPDKDVDFFRSIRVFMRDRRNHSSPNSAHGESAFAGVLNVRLGGAAIYNGKIKFRKFINVEAKDPEIYDILRSWKLLDISCSLFSVFIILLCLI